MLHQPELAPRETRKFVNCISIYRRDHSLFVGQLGEINKRARFFASEELQRISSEGAAGVAYSIAARARAVLSGWRRRRRASSSIACVVCPSYFPCSGNVIRGAASARPSFGSACAVDVMMWLDFFFFFVRTRWSSLRGGEDWCDAGACARRFYLMMLRRCPWLAVHACMRSPSRWHVASEIVW